jgi:hypothetical protein
MYGLEKTPKALFEFDLEKELKKNPSKVHELVKKADVKIQEIKNLLRQGSKGPELDQLGILLHGYTAFQKVLNKLANKK